MTATVFDNGDGAGDKPYQQWLHDHPTGMVLNTRRWYDPAYMVLHRASCHSIRRAGRQVDKNPFTGRGYVKVCSEEPDALLAWISQHGGEGFTKRCSICGS